jgi:hypothetical protein
VHNQEPTLNGGPGSGNFGHAGVPGQVGGSSSGVIADTEVSARNIETPNKVTDKELYKSLVTSMEVDGWKGAPVLAVDKGDGVYTALTGSHRIYAARKVGIDVPVALIDADKLKKWLDEDPDNFDRAFDRYSNFRVDDARGETESVLAEIGDSNALKLYQSELQKNSTENTAKNSHAALWNQFKSRVSSLFGA